jgi:hypothetical protein
VTEVSDFLRRVIGHLDESKIPYMVAGSLASNAYGHFRSTNDVDIVIQPDTSQLTNFIRAVSKDFYVEPRTAHDALARKSMFNIIDYKTGFKADFIVCKPREFSGSEFGRRQLAHVAEIDAWTATPEDTILAKLEWAKIGESERQYQDAFHIASVQRERLDRAYMRKWAVELDVMDLLERLLTEAGLTDDRSQ